MQQRTCRQASLPSGARQRTGRRAAAPGRAVHVTQGLALRDLARQACRLAVLAVQRCRKIVPHTISSPCCLCLPLQCAPT